MKLNTASSAISFAKMLEGDSAGLYEVLAQRYPDGRETFLAWVKENAQYKALMDRAYYGVITDALEGGFSFEGIDTDDYALAIRMPEDASLEDALRAALAAEERIAAFYRAAIDTSKSLMADVPRAFTRIVSRRSGRMPKLRSLLATWCGVT